jgi:hypothetical protein
MIFCAKLRTLWACAPGWGTGNIELFLDGRAPVQAYRAPISRLIQLKKIISSDFVAV